MSEYPPFDEDAFEAWWTVKAADDPKKAARDAYQFGATHMLFATRQAASYLGGMYLAPTERVLAIAWSYPELPAKWWVVALDTLDEISAKSEGTPRQPLATIHALAGRAIAAVEERHEGKGRE